VAPQRVERRGIRVRNARRNRRRGEAGDRTHGPGKYRVTRSRVEPHDARRMMADTSPTSAAASAHAHPSPAHASRALALVSLATLLGMALWFVGSALMPQLTLRW